MNESSESQELITAGVVERAVELIFRASFAPARVADLLLTSDTRSRIRKLSPAQLFFGLSELDNQQMQQLLPHVTAEQWTAILDLSIWDRDEADTDDLLSWQKHLVGAEDAVARKLWRATPTVLWELAFCRDLRITRRRDDDSFEEDFGDENEVLITPDNAYLIQLPEDSDRAEVWKVLIPKLYHLEPEQMGLFLEESLFRTSTELEEMAYQERCRRLEDIGFQDYFDAITIYTPLPLGAGLPFKSKEADTPLSTLPHKLRATADVLFLQALAQIQDNQVLQQILEETFFVCNKLLSADRVLTEDPERLRETIQKCLAGLNLGLSLRSGDNVSVAADVLREHYLQNLFQIAFGQLEELRVRASDLLSRGIREDLFEQATLEALEGSYPRLAELEEGRVVLHHFWNRQHLRIAHRRLDRISSSG